MITARVICLAIGYIAGLFQTGLFYGKMKHTDLRKQGSGNTGMTNSIRVLGWKAGVIVSAGDIFKAVLAMIVAWLLFRTVYPSGWKLLQMYAGLGAVLGHNFPFYLKFKGGKGIACTVGIVCAFHPLMVPVCAVLFFAAVIPTGFMSLGSLMISGGFLLQVLLFGQMGWLHLAQTFLTELYFITIILTILAFIKHKDNIRRLIRGEENKFRPKGNK